MNPVDTSTTLSIRHDTAAPRAAGVCLTLGVVLYVLPTILHGNPPIDDAEATLEYVDDRSLWTIAHYANVGGVVLWAVGFALVSPALPRAMASAARTTWAIAGGSFGIYFGLHALGLRTAADQFTEAGADRAAVVERTEALLLVLGSAAFVAQALVGIAVALTGLCLLRTIGTSRVLAMAGIVIGVGWTVGAVLIDFAVIVPFTTLAWVWMTILGVRLVLARGPSVPRSRDPQNAPRLTR